MTVFPLIQTHVDSETSDNKHGLHMYSVLYSIKKVVPAVEYSFIFQVYSAPATQYKAEDEFLLFGRDSPLPRQLSFSDECGI